MVFYGFLTSAPASTPSKIRRTDKVRSYAAPPTPFPCRSAPCARNRGQGPLQVDAEFLVRAGRPPLPPGEGWGEGAASTRNTAVAGKHRSRASSRLREAVPARAYRLTPNFSFAPDSSLSLRERAGVRERRQPETSLSPVSTVREQARAYEKLCPRLQVDAEFLVRAGRLPLPLGEGWGEGAASTRDTAVAGKHRSRARSYRLTPNFPLAPDGSLSLRERAGVRERRQPETPLPPVSTVREQARAYEKPCLPMRWG